ncbi:MAG: UDP-N-acetylglucosamine--N-acetylmuramyl-(pentapeptide) pyrophosphoryl-undecaprenol N-acetylglucosamine transferase [Sideroxydans sp.]|nr:UDP-N-acetylglucosamine--N-acetylmuramyl-(pentapeptide) pyrophosphoryl-undecaprenol N-acetylglucosamine transferase [Sideroxydans sp.]
MNRTILIMAGGTGGHIYPGLAVADALRAQGWHVVWLGAPNSMEAELVPKHGYPVAWVNFSGVRGKGVLRLLTLPFTLLRALGQSADAILRHRPDVVLGMGGYITIPGGLMAALLRRSLVIHEQNSIAGMSNKVLAKLATRVLSGFPGVLGTGKLTTPARERPSIGDLRNDATEKPESTGLAKSSASEKRIWCGNPVRADIAALPEPQLRYAARSGKLNVLVVGGSLGAKALNEALPQALALLHVGASLLAKATDKFASKLAPTEEHGFNVVHQTGKKNFDSVVELYKQAGASADIRPFLDDMAQQYANADVVICRAGALTIAELAAAGVASVLVPFPFAVDDHQTFNARFLSEHGAAVLLPQTELNAKKLAQLLREMSREKLLAMAQAARALAKPDATGQVAKVCRELAE